MRLIVEMSRLTRREVATELSKLRRKIKREVVSFEGKAEREYKKGKRQARQPIGVVG